MVRIIKQNKIRFQTYRPKQRIELDKSNILSWINYLSKELLWFGGALWVAISGIFIGVKGFFFAKKKIRSIQAKHEKTVDLTSEGKKRARFRMNLE